MRFTETPLKGAFLIEPERIEDERGFFARTFCRKEFEARGLNAEIAQCSVSFNRRKGTLRGMHFQIAPHAEDKVVRCTDGAIYDVIVDLRPDSPTFTRWTATELTAENRRMFYIPAGCAHGFQTLQDNVEVLYQMSESYHPESARGVRWDDPAFAITWPEGPRLISDRDRSFADFSPEGQGRRVKDIIFWGGTGQAKVVREFIGQIGYRLVAVFDNDPQVKPPFPDVPIFYGEAGFHAWRKKRARRALAGLVTIGGNHGNARLKLQRFLEDNGMMAITAVHPTAFVAGNARVGKGSQVLARSCVCAEAVIGEACIINTAASVDHESVLGDGVHVGPGATLAGCVQVGPGAFIGTGAVVLPRIRIGRNAVIGAGAVVTRDVPDGRLVYGNPARVHGKAPTT